ncbi:MAG: YdhR family protein [Bacteroidota bacterium]|nr:YdhR family protein [Bacteroidota bacterium]
MKKFLLVLLAVFTFSCNQTEKKESEEKSSIQEMVLVVNYELQDMSLEDHAKLGSEVAPNFKPENVEGLIGKTFIGNVDAGVFGGVYYFSSPESVDAYLDSELWKGVVAHPNLVNFTTDVYGVAPISEVSNGLSINRSTSSEASDAEGMMVLVVNYELEDMSLEDHAKLGSEVAPNFNPENIDGLIGKTFIGNVDAGVFGGVYYFSSPESVDAYLDSELWKGVVAHPNLVNFTTDVYGVAPITISNGIPVL